MNALNNVRIGSKLITSFILVALIAATVGAIGIFNIRTIDAADTMLYENGVLPIEYLGQMQNDLQRTRIEVRDVILAGTDSQRIKAALNDLQTIRAEIDTVSALYDKAIMADQTAQRAAYNDFLVLRKEIRPLQDQVIELAKQGKTAEAVDLLEGDAFTAAKAEEAKLQELMDLEVENAKEISDNNTVLANAAVTTMAVAIAISVILAIVLGIILSNSITKPMQEGVTMMDEMSKGRLSMRLNFERKDEVGMLARAMDKFAEDLQKNVIGSMQKIAAGDLNIMTLTKDTQDEVGPAIDKMAASLKDMIVKIGEASNNLNSAAAEILAATTQQASGASEQSAAVTQTTTTVDEVKAISEQVVERAREVTESSRRTVEVSGAGQKAVQETIDSMYQIKEKVEGIAENILALSEKTQQIGEIISTVNDIASQSNMLALNASIEAARAGEHGKGFAVVAMEVRNLAEQSKAATAQVGAILSEIQNATNTTVMVTEEGTKGVDRGVRLAAQSQEAIEKLADTIRESTQAAMQVMAGGQQQATGIEQISLAMKNINQVTVQSMASTKQAEKAAQNLNELSRKLSDTLQAYRAN